MLAGKPAYHGFFGNHEKTHFGSPRRSFLPPRTSVPRDPSYNPPCTPSCTSEARDADGVNRANGEKYKSDRTWTVHMWHRERPRPIETSFRAGRVAQLTCRRQTAGQFGGPKPRFFRKRVFGGGGVLAILADSWVGKKTGVTASCHGQFHGHRILVQKMATSLQSLS